jgi:hypothetical protein
MAELLSNGGFPSEALSAMAAAAETGLHALFRSAGIGGDAAGATGFTGAAAESAPDDPVADPSTPLRTDHLQVLVGRGLLPEEEMARLLALRAVASGPSAAADVALPAEAAARWLDAGRRLLRSIIARVRPVECAAP